MSALTSPKGPLPARVYWVRRLLLLSVVFLLVFTGSRLFGGSGDEPGAEAAQTGAQRTEQLDASDDAAGEQGSASGAQAGAAGSDGAGQEQGRKKRPAPPKPPPLPEPSGTCEASDVTVTPKVASKVRRNGLKIKLKLRTTEADACTWTVSAETVTARITSGPDSIWTSQQCPAAIPTTEVVVRNVEDTTVPVWWNLRRSDDECSVHADWARLGWYHVATATYGGEPSSVQFEIARAPQKVVEKKAGAQGNAKQKHKNRARNGSRNNGGNRTGGTGGSAGSGGDDSREHREGDTGGGVAEPNG